MLIPIAGLTFKTVVAFGVDDFTGNTYGIHTALSCTGLAHGTTVRLVSAPPGAALMQSHHERIKHAKTTVRNMGFHQFGQSWEFKYRGTTNSLIFINTNSSEAVNNRSQSTYPGPCMPSDSTRRFPQGFLLAISCTATVLTFFIILMSAYIRLAESGLGCSPWPECFAHFSTSSQTQGVLIPLEGDHRALRSLHRLFASVLTLLVLIITYISFWYRAAHGIGLRLPSGILIVTVVLAVLGINTPDREFPSIAFGNLVGGFILLSLLYWLVLLLLYEKTTTDNSSASYHPSGLSRFVLLAVCLQIVSGGWASANYATAACSGLFHCSEVDYSQLIHGFNLLRHLPLYQPEGILVDPSAASILLGHHLLAVLLSVVVAVCLYSLFRQANRLKINLVVMLIFLIIDFSVGLLGTRLDNPLWAGTLHSLFSILLLLATIHLTFMVHGGYRKLRFVTGHH